VNRRLGCDSWLPIVLLDAHHEPAEVYRFLRAADVCYVSSLHDGMNLVAKEFVAARDDEQGALVLSAFAGASRELREALIVNPYDVDSAAHALAAGLSLPREEQRRRMSGMRATVAEHNAYKWAARILTDMSRLRVPLPVEVRWPVTPLGAATDFTAMM
jgi:trehalose 6-phosphate synthase